MSYPINYPTPQGANVQIFSEGGTASDWVKPQGASFVWFTLIGGGGNGNSAAGGGSGSVTNFMCPAFLIPDILRIKISPGDSIDTEIIYQQKNTTGYTLLTAISGTTTSAGTASAANAFTAMGFFQSVAGQIGIAGAQTASSTTFLSGGGGTSSLITSNYGYSVSGNAASGIFQMQPIIVGVGGNTSAKGGVGCGGGISYGVGGNGLAVIITW